MLCKRIIPCLDVDGGRVKKGVRFKELRDAGDPVEVAAAYDAPGRRRDLLPRHLRVVRRARHDARRRARHRRARVPAAHRRRRRALGRGRARAAARGRRQGRHQHRGGRRSRAGAPRRRRLRQPGDRRRRRRAARPGRRGEPPRWEVYTHGGRRPTGLDAVAWCERMAARGRRRDPAHQHGPRRHARRLRPRADARGRRSACRSR